MAHVAIAFRDQPKDLKRGIDVGHGLISVDLAEWRSAADGGTDAELRDSLDNSLRLTGAFEITGHGVPTALVSFVRESAREFFELPESEKRPCHKAHGADTGWQGIGTLAPPNGGLPSRPPELFENYQFSAVATSDRPESELSFFPENKWPAQSPRMRQFAEEYAAHMAAVSREVLDLLAWVLGVPPEVFASAMKDPCWTQSLNWYPSFTMVGEVLPGQRTVGEHADFGTITILDRQPGAGGLEVWNPQQGWFAPPVSNGSLTVIVGELMHRWTGGRWRALRHRVAPPTSADPDQHRISLVHFLEADPEAEIRPLDPPHGAGATFKPVRSGEHIRNLALGLG
jgi:isopenicillin N synthase-like dioxygenase